MIKFIECDGQNRPILHIFSDKEQAEEHIGCSDIDDVIIDGYYEWNEIKWFHAPDGVTTDDHRTE